MVCLILGMLCIFFFKQKTAYEMRISDWSSDVCSSDLFEDDDITMRTGEWQVTDADGDTHEFTSRRIFRWTFPFDTFVVTEHMMEYRLADGTLGYGLGECGFRLPWAGNNENI